MGNNSLSDMLSAQGAIRLRRANMANKAQAVSRVILRKMSSQVKPSAQPIVARTQELFTRVFSKIPKGFENFFPKSGSAKKTAEKASKAKPKKESGGSGGGGGSEDGGSNMLPNGVTPANVMWLGVGTLGLMFLMGGLTESRREINWHEFKYQLLEQKLVDRVEVVNGNRVNVYLKASSALGLGAGGMQQGAQGGRRCWRRWWHVQGWQGQTHCCDGGKRHRNQ